jgi:predicted nucleic acid-binding protein
MVALQYTVDHQETAHAWAEIFTLAKHHNTTIDEASYLELALRTKLPLATLDPTLLRVAANAGVAIYNP